MADPIQHEAEQAVHEYLTAQARQTPGRDVPYSELEQTLRKKGFSPGAIFQAWTTLQSRKS